MTKPDQREQWAEHLRDEAVERQSQQRSAGGSHMPVGGPLPFSADDLEAAVRGERERCAALVDRWAEEGSLRRAFPAFTDSQLQAAREALRTAARSVRDQQGGGERLPGAN